MNLTQVSIPGSCTHMKSNKKFIYENYISSLINYVQKQTNIEHYTIT